MNLKSVLILCAHRPQRSPSQRYRFEQYLSLLESRGFTFTLSYLLNEKDDVLFYSESNFPGKVFILIKSVLIRIRDCFRFKKYDIIFIQREASFLGTTFFERCAYRSGARVIFDFDDSIWLADTSPGNKKWEWIKKPEKFFRNIQLAHTVIAGNNYLADKARSLQPNTVVIPTTIDTGIHAPKPELRNGNKIVIGWSGSISTIKHFNALLPVLLKIKEKYSDTITFRILADKLYPPGKLEVESILWSAQTEVDELNRFDIGIMPLPNDAWSAGKCGLKGLSYMACGVATVMEKVGVNTEIISQGHNGFLVGTHDEWFETLCLLIENKELRLRLGAEGRNTVLEHYSVLANEQKYLDVFKNG